jgi:poly(A)-specific ribonuclease
MMEVTDVNFHFLLPTILKSIAEAAFVAIDIEMSGISTRLSAGTDRQHDHGKPTLQKQYEDSKLAAEKYQILQLGITCVEEDRKNGRILLCLLCGLFTDLTGWYVARPYNINMSPLFLRGDQLGINRDITLSSSAMHFLLKNNFDIGTVFKRGVPYLSRMEEAYARQKFSERQDVISNIPDLVIEESNQAGWDFYRSMKKQITEWLADPKVGHLSTIIFTIYNVILMKVMNNSLTWSSLLLATSPFSISFSFSVLMRTTE